MNKKLKNISSKIGDSSLALLWCLADRGSLIIKEILSGNKKSLGSRLRAMDGLRKWEDYEKAVNAISDDGLRNILSRLKNKGLVKRVSRGSYSITEAGANFLQNIQGEHLEWDGKWRMVLFDIPESRRTQRIWLNARLARSEYRQIQKSVLIGKFPLDEDLVKELLERNLYQHVRIITIGEIDDEKILEI